MSQDQMPAPTTPNLPTAPTSAAAWKQSKSVGAPLLVPSGNTCLVRPVSMQQLVQNKVIPNDLLGIVKDAMANKQGPSASEVMEEMDMDRLISVMKTMDEVVMYVVVEPRLTPVPPDIENIDGTLSPGPRDPDLLYIDEIEEDDKSFIWQYAVGGTRDVEKFRQGLASYVGNVEEKPGMAHTPE